MSKKASIARIWRGRTRRAVADEYEAYNRAEGIPPLKKTALGVQLFREDRDDETWFTTISYWPDMESMTAFTKGSPTRVHHSIRRTPCSSGTREVRQSRATCWAAGPRL
jgi:heme-degrading monooxygenase HmoA